MPSGPPHAWLKSARAQGREQVAGRRAQPAEHPLVAVERGGDARAPVVGRAPATEHEPVVGGALAVDDEVAVVGERLPAREPRRVPELRGHRTRGDDQRVHRHDRARRELRRPRLGGAHDRARRDDAAVGHHPARPHRGGGGGLDDAPAAALDGPREAPHEPRGLDACAVRRVRRAQHAGGADERRRLLRRDEARPRHGPGAAAPGCGRGRSCRPSPSRRRCPPRPPPCRPRRRCRASPRPSPAPPPRPCRRVSAASLAGNSAEHQPPLRPLAPKPATCRSTTSTRRPGSPRSRW